MFEKLKNQNDAMVGRLDSVFDKYTKVEAELRERMRELMDVRQAVEIIGQRQENLEVVQGNIEKLKNGNLFLSKNSRKELIGVNHHL
jgi:hypothetical protein